MKEFLCAGNIDIPEIQVNSSYYILYLGTKYEKIENLVYPRNEYIDSNNKTFYFCSASLLEPGLWRVYWDLTEKNNSMGSSSIGWGLRDDRGYIRDLMFKVRPKSEVLSLYIQNLAIVVSIFAIIVTLLIGLGTILIQIELAKKEDRRKIKEEVV